VARSINHGYEYIYAVGFVVDIAGNRLRVDGGLCERVKNDTSSKDQYCPAGVPKRHSGGSRHENDTVLWYAANISRFGCGDCPIEITIDLHFETSTGAHVRIVAGAAGSQAERQRYARSLYW
jgi:hypothetical protein